MQVLSSFDILKGKKIQNNAYAASYFQPLNFIPTSQKDLSWRSSYMNYIEWRGLTQIRENANWMMKNYKLAIGEIEKTDYIKQDNEYAPMIHALEQQSGKTLESMEIKPYAFTNTVVNILKDEFAKRSSHMSFGDRSDIAANEKLEAKKEEVDQYLQQQAAIKQQAKMLQLGFSPDSEQGKQMTDPNTIKNLPQIQQYYSKSYRNIYQEWAEHQMYYDSERFAMPELEKTNFVNMLCVDREFWHFKMFDNDYKIQTWNPPQVAYRKSPSTRYMSDATWIMHVDYMTVPDVIDSEGWKMSEDQLMSLNQIQGARAVNYALDGKEPDQYWDATKSYDWNRTGPGIAMRQALSVLDNVSGVGGDITKAIINEGEDVYSINGEYMLRVSTVYWKTQRKYYHLTKVDDQGNLIQDVVGEDYKVTTQPMYNTVLFKEKTKENLISGEHLDPYWANETWGGVRIGTNTPALGWQGTPSYFAPIYLGIKGPEPGRLPFQFKGDNNIYECKLPVEGRVFNDHNTKSRSLVDNLKSWQIGVNVTGNLIQDTMINDLGVIAQIDPNALAKHSLSEDWGPDTWSAAITSMKVSGSIPMLSHGRSEDGIPIGNEPLRKVDLSQTERLLGLMKIFDWFKINGLDSVGMNPRRTGTPIGQESTATEVNQDIASSYSHTEYLFSQHSDDLMPRVWQMDIDCAQFYNSTNPSLRLQYIADSGAEAEFMLDGTGLMGRDFNCKPKTTVNTRAIMQKIEQMLLKDNTSDTDFYDKIRAIQTPTLSELNGLMKQFQQKAEQDKMAQQQAEQAQQKAEQDHEMQLLQEKQQFEAQENDKDRANELEIAEVKGAGPTGGVGQGDSHESNYLDALNHIQGQQQHNDKMNLERQKLQATTDLKKEDIGVQEKKVTAENKRTQSLLQEQKVANRVKTRDKNKKK